MNISIWITCRLFAMTSAGSQEYFLESKFHLALKIDTYSSKDTAKCLAPWTRVQYPLPHRMSVLRNSLAKLATIIIGFGGIFCQYYLNKVAEHIVSEGAIFEGASTVRLNKKQVLMPCAEMALHKKEIDYRFSMWNIWYHKYDTYWSKRFFLRRSLSLSFLTCVSAKIWLFSSAQNFLRSLTCQRHSCTSDTHAKYIISVKMLYLVPTFDASLEQMVDIANFYF